MTRTDPDAAFASRPPIILVGTQRSGTTYLGSLLGNTPGLRYWEEPRHIWIRGNAYAPDDRLTKAHARPRVRKAIRSAFAEFAGDDRFCEKTPSNCTRLPFINEVLPEAKILLIVRDGRAVLRSTGEIMNAGIPSGRILKRARQTPPWEWPAFLGQTASALHRKITHKPLKYWGAKPPGWKQWIGLPRDEMIAHQWAGAITCALDDAPEFNGHQLLTFRYEQLMDHPESTARKIADFLDLEDADRFINEICKTADPSRTDKWREQLDQSTLEAVKPIMLPVLERLGYQW
ncbi:MAG TPA: sulfotransferase [Phycisphaerales bacterium]|nr:sulfotransferase [Phycisphaerales bacterium]